MWSPSAPPADLTVGLPGPMLGRMAPEHAGGHWGFCLVSSAGESLLEVKGWAQVTLPGGEAGRWSSLVLALSWWLGGWWKDP